MNRRTFLTTAATGLALFPVTRLLAQGSARRGTFEGASGHSTTGTAEIVDRQVNLLDDFAFDGGAPDVKVALGRDGYDTLTLLGPLSAETGASSYALSEGIDPADYNEIWIWCEKFAVPLGVAKLN